MSVYLQKKRVASEVEADILNSKVVYCTEEDKVYFLRSLIYSLNGNNKGVTSTKQPDELLNEINGI